MQFYTSQTLPERLNRSEVSVRKIKATRLPAPLYRMTTNGRMFVWSFEDVEAAIAADPGLVLAPIAERPNDKRAKRKGGDV